MQAGSTRQLMAQDNFLFVPYHFDPKYTDDIRIAKHNARSHAAAISRRRRDDERSRAQLELRNLTIGDLDSLTVRTSRELESLGQETSPRSSALANDSVMLSRRGKSNAPRPQQMRAMQFSWRAGNLLPNNSLGSQARLNSTRLSFDSAFARAAIGYFWHVVSPASQPIYSIFNVTNVYASFWNVLMLDEDYQPAGVAMVGAMMQMRTKPEDHPSEDVRMYQALAVARLQRKHKEAKEAGYNTMDDMTIVTVLTLANLARFLDDPEAYGTYRTMLRTVVQARGGLDALGHGRLVKSVVMQWDSFWVFESEEGLPLFPNSHIEPPPVYPAFPLDEDLRTVFLKLPLGFQSLIMKGKVSVETFEILGRAVETRESAQKSKRGYQCYKEGYKYHDFIEACPCLSIADSVKTTIEKELCLAVLLYCFNLFAIVRSPTSLYSAARTELTRLLMRLDESIYSFPEQECLYWIAMVCIDSWRRNGAGFVLLPKGHQLLSVMHRLRQNHAGHNLLLKFLHDDNLLQASENYILL